MKYFNFILLGFILSFSTIYYKCIFALKSTGKENLKVSLLLILFSTPIAICILIAMSLFLKLANWTLPVEISNYKIFIVSFASVFVIFIGEFIIKTFLSGTISSHFTRKYKNENLSEKQMLNIIREKHRIIEIMKFILMFLISCVIYGVLLSILNVIGIIFIVITSSLITSILYFFMFKSK